jgi:quercetin dioxygenase-like cupin family protein
VIIDTSTNSQYTSVVLIPGREQAGDAAMTDAQEQEGAMGTRAASVDVWQGVADPSETELARIMRDQGLDPYRWSNRPGETYAAHLHPYHKVIYVVHGSITFTFPSTGQRITLGPGDRLNLPPGIAHEGVVGPEGVICLEAHRP